MNKNEENNKSKISKKMSYLLRHDPEELSISRDGWVLIEDLCRKIKIEKNLILDIVKEDNKGRYSISEDGFKVRANQGHSIDVKIDFQKKIPPVTLYHGTDLNSYSLIKKSGIKKMNRQFVHLSADKDTAFKVGKRHSRNADPIIIEVDTKQMVKDNVDFYLSENGVWLVDFVDKKYLK
jgi:putative RNA 2'-phosphotransferase